MEKITLFTRQHQDARKILEQDGVFRMKPEWIMRKYGDISDHFMKSYDWLTHASAKRVPKPQGVTYPIWCNISEEYMLRAAPGESIFKLSISKDKIIYFDTLKWDYILNQMYIPIDEADRKDFQEELNKRGLANEFVLFSRDVARFYPNMVNRVKASWDRLFLIEDWNIFSVQANIWEIHLEDVLDIQD